MQKDNTIGNNLRAIILILFSIKLIVACIQQADYINTFYSIKIFREDPILILRRNLLFEPIILLIGIIGLFIRKRIGFVLMLLLPSMILTYSIIPAFTPYFNFESVWLRIIPVILFYTLINLKIVRSIYRSTTIKQTVLLNIYAIVVGIIISLVMLYFKGLFGA